MSGDTRNNEFLYDGIKELVPTSIQLNKSEDIILSGITAKGPAIPIPTLYVSALFIRELV